jgi:hypothetical protein
VINNIGVYRVIGDFACKDTNAIIMIRAIVLKQLVIGIGHLIPLQRCYYKNCEKIVKGVIYA